MQAVEHQPLEQTLLSPFTTDLLQQGRLSLITPAPLGEQRDRFLALLADMKLQGKDYISQLGMLTLAGMNQRQETKSSILSSLLRRVDLPGSANEEEQILWQARMVLKLGELYERQQAGLDEALRRITRQRENLLTELRDEEENIFSLTDSLQDSTHGTASVVQHNLKAWTRLFFHTPPAVESAVYITRHEGALDALREVYTTRTGHDPQVITALDLPACEDKPIPVVPLADTLFQRCPVSLQEPFLKLSEQRASRPGHLETMIRLFAQQATRWNECMQTCYPLGRFGRCTLELVAFPETSTADLFMESFCGEHPSGRNETTDSPSGVIIGLVKQDSASRE